MNTERLVIFIPSPKCGLNLAAFHIYSWTYHTITFIQAITMEIPPIQVYDHRVFGYLRLESLKWIAVLDLDTCIYIPVRCYHYY